MSSENDYNLPESFRDPSSRAEAFLRAAVWSGAGGNPAQASGMLALYPELAAADFWCACVAGNADAVEAALQKKPELARRKGGALGWEPLLYACFSSFLETGSRRGEGEPFVRIVDQLLNVGADPNAAFTAPEASGSPRETALYGASGIANHPGVTERLLKAGADPNDGEPENGGPETVYHTAEFRDLRCLRLLFAHGVSQAARDYCLYRQLDFEAPEGTRLFLENGANPNGKPGPLGTALHHAIRRGRSREVIRLLLAAGADPRRTDAAGLTPYRLAARLGRDDLLAELEKVGGAGTLTTGDRFLAASGRGDPAAMEDALRADPALPEALGSEAMDVLLIAVQRNRMETVRLLLDAGLPVDGTDPTMRPLHWAAWFGHVETVEMLLRYRPDLEAVNQYGGTPLGVTVFASRHCAGADRGEKNGRMLTPEEQEENYRKIALQLLWAGAVPREEMLGNGIPAVEAVIRAALKA